MEIEQLKKILDKFGKNVRFEHDLKKKNWFNIGGKSKVFYKADNLKELVNFLKKLNDQEKIFVLGAGSNTLINDNLFDGVVIKLSKNFNNVSLLGDDIIIAGSAVLDKSLSEFAMKNSLSGFEFLSCIPGTIGGGIRMNAGCFGNEFRDIAQPDFNEPTRIRTVISADFDNDGFDEIFMNNIGQPNKLFKILDNGVLKKIDIQVGLEYFGLGTGAAVADIDNDGILELLVSRGESKAQSLTLYKAKVEKQSKFLRIKPINKFGAPARGATVTLISNKRKHSKTIDAGSGYLCQMEPVAHYGIRKNEKDFRVEVKWTNGKIDFIDKIKLNQTITINQK